MVFQVVTTAEAVHARIAKSEMLKPCRPMEARGPGEFVLICEETLRDKKAAVEHL